MSRCVYYIEDVYVALLISYSRPIADLHVALRISCSRPTNSVTKKAKGKERRRKKEFVPLNLVVFEGVTLLIRLQTRKFLEKETERKRKQEKKARKPTPQLGSPRRDHSAYMSADPRTP